jgi:hypothetical protein
MKLSNETKARIAAEMREYSDEDLAGFFLSQMQLDALEDNGVENWIGYDDAMNMYHTQLKLEMEVR